MTAIFDEIKPNENLNFGELNSSDLAYLLNLVNQYKLSLREQLGVSIDETIGLELECDNANWERIREGKLDDWELVDDATLENGAELKSPKLRDTKEAWQDLKNMCELLSRYSEIGKHCGSHVHIGKQAFGIKNESFINFMKLWAIYEPIIFRFTYGEFLGPRPFFTIVSKSISRFLWICVNTLKKKILTIKIFLFGLLAKMMRLLDLSIGLI